MFAVLSQAELLEFGTFEVGSGVPTPGGVFVTAESDLSSPSTPVITPGTHSEPIPAMACAAFGLLCSGLVEAPAVRDARRHGGSRADLGVYSLTLKHSRVLPPCQLWSRA